MSCLYLRTRPPEDMVGQVIPSVSPGRGAEYFHKTECFCFEQQKLLAGERVELPVVFIVDPNIPLDIGSLSLGYTLFDITDQTKRESNRGFVGDNRCPAHNHTTYQNQASFLLQWL